jgi:hypothetical protein
VGPKPVWVRVPPSALSFLRMKKTNAYGIGFFLTTSYLLKRDNLIRY